MVDQEDQLIVLGGNCDENSGIYPHERIFLKVYDLKVAERELLGRLSDQERSCQLFQAQLREQQHIVSQVSCQCRCC